jgi:hypothetical protein
MHLIFQGNFQHSAYKKMGNQTSSDFCVVVSSYNDSKELPGLMIKTKVLTTKMLSTILAEEDPDWALRDELKNILTAIKNNPSTMLDVYCVLGISDVSAGKIYPTTYIENNDRLRKILDVSKKIDPYFQTIGNDRKINIGQRLVYITIHALDKMDENKASSNKKLALNVKKIITPAASNSLMNDMYFFYDGNLLSD